MKQNSPNIFEEGQVLLIDKPLRWTSFDVIRKIRGLTRTKKVGHAGTLDPLATGLLIVCTGKFTKRINEYMAMEKEYTGTITLGGITPTYDLESEPGDFKPFDKITKEDILRVARQFTGDINQYPPAHSALRIGGRRMYELAREGKEINIEPRSIRISEYEITNIEMPVLQFRVSCSTGTYIRSLAFDTGKELGCGGYLSSLCRTRIGEFRLENALSMEAFEEKIKQAGS